jgi:hypothetical protein
LVNIVEAKAKFINVRICDRVGKRGKHRASEGVCPRAAHKKEFLFLEAEAEILLPFRQNVHRDKEMGHCGFINAGNTFNGTLFFVLVNFR